MSSARPEQPHTTATTLSHNDFDRAVLDLNPTIAVFDCDGTLWSGDAGSSFMHWSIKQGLLSREATGWLELRYHLYLSGQVSELAICGEMVQVYRGLAESQMRTAAAEFFRTHTEKHIFPELLALVRALQARGTDIWAVSSTCDWVIEEGVRRFDIPANRVLAARVAIHDGIVTDTLLDVPTDQGKVDSLLRAGVLHPDVVFGNSIHDAAMLAIARSQKGTSGAFPINPNAALLARSAHEGWPVFYPASVAPEPHRTSKCTQEAQSHDEDLKATT